MLARRIIGPALFAVAAGAVLGLMFPTPALAYLDPGTGSLVFQWIIGGVVGVALVARTFGGRIMTFFRKRERTDDSDEE
jgi:hypothetical protein